jgi:hypothetical protein
MTPQISKESCMVAILKECDRIETECRQAIRDFQETIKDKMDQWNEETKGLFEENKISKKLSNEIDKLKESTDQPVAWKCEIKSPLTEKWVKRVYLFNPRDVKKKDGHTWNIRRVQPLYMNSDFKQK